MLNRKKGTKEKIAENDIICYKEIIVVGGELRAPIQEFIYELGKLYTTKFSPIENNLILGENCKFADHPSENYYTPYFISGNSDKWAHYGSTSNEVVAYNEGFHSYKERKERYAYPIPNVECTIPKGTKYIEDETGLICSEAIIINKVLE